MLNPKLCASLDGLAHQRGYWAIWRQDFPNGIIIALCTQAYLCVTRKAGEDLWSQLLGVQIKRLMENVRVGDKSYLIAVAYLAIRRTVANTLNIKNRPAAWADILGGGSASIRLVDRDDLIVHIKNEEAIRLLIH